MAVDIYCLKLVGNDRCFPPCYFILVGVDRLIGITMTKERGQKERKRERERERERKRERER
jgi:hypothetical protein